MSRGSITDSVLGVAGVYWLVVQAPFVIDRVRATAVDLREWREARYDQRRDAVFAAQRVGYRPPAEPPSHADRSAA